MENTKSNKNKEIIEANKRFLQFDLGKESYAIPLLDVKEVITPPAVTTLPNSPSYYIGIMNLRGVIISIIDLRKKLQISAKEKDLEEAVIIVEIEDVRIGLLVDSINKVLNFSQNDVSEVPEVNMNINGKFIQGVYKAEKSLTILLDLENILNVNEIKQFKKIA